MEMFIFMWNHFFSLIISSHDKLYVCFQLFLKFSSLFPTKNIFNDLKNDFNNFFM